MTTAHATLEAKTRTTSGKGFARRTRLEGLIPGIIYGKHLEKPISIALDPLLVRKAVQTPKKLNTLISLKVDGKAHLVMLKEYQQDPVSRALLHADFVDVRETEQVKVNVPVVLIGKAIGVADGGILSQQRREIEVWALPGSIPEQIEADISALKIAMALHINDIKLPAGVTVKSHVNYTLAVCVAPEAEVVAVAAVPVAGAEGAAAAVPGAADAKGADGKAAPAAKAGDAKAADAKAAPAAAAKKK